MKRLIAAVVAVLLLGSLFLMPLGASAQEEKELRILFTHDIHSHFLNTTSVIDGELREHGGAARLQTLLDENRTEHSVYLDGGDFSMGTLLQAGYSTDAYELRLLGELGCDATTFGNHEFDYGDDGVAKMLAAAQASGDRLPELVQSNLVLEGELTPEQKTLADAMAAYGVKKYTVLERDGVKMAVFGLFGLDSLDCTPTTKMEFTNYIESAKETVATIQSEVPDADLIICLSHSGTSGDGVNGEDFDLAKAVPEIDVILSGHSHCGYEKPVTVGKTLVIASGAYLINLGVLDLSIGADGVRCTDYRLLPCDGSVADEPEMAALLAEYKQRINETYLADEGVGYDDVLCRNDIAFMSFEEMEATHQEYPFGNLIADSYLYEARRNGIDDIDVALVGLGTIRGVFRQGEITTGNAFEICSLGVGADGSAGHPIFSGYITGKELKLIAELDASFGPMLSYIKMSYSGLKFTFNESRMLLDRVTDICLVRPDGTEEAIDDGKLYKVACNMYAGNMLGMLNGLTYGILKVVPKDADGNPIEDLYDISIRNTDGKEVKEWVAFKNYLRSFDKEDGVSVIPARYAAAEGRKVKIAEGGLAAIRHPGATTLIVMGIVFVIVAVMVLIMVKVIRRNTKKKGDEPSAEGKPIE